MRHRKFVALAAAAVLGLASLPASAAEKRSLCIFDIVGQSGDTFNMMRDYRTAALAWGVDFDLKVYTD
jgi:ABC-type sugar transport system substrate-binding protein